MQKKQLHWKAMTAIAVIAICVFCDIYWIWGVLFLIWAINDILSRATYLFELVERDDSPLLFWIIILMWISLSLWSLSYLLYPYYY